MRDRTPAPRVVRLLATLVLVVGVAAMHHLVASGCTSMQPAHSPDHAVAHTIEVSPVVVVASSGSDASSRDAATGAVSVEHSGDAVCLAVIVLLWSVAPLLRWWRGRGEDQLHSHARGTAILLVDRPPDLIQLSVSRT